MAENFIEIRNLDKWGRALDKAPKIVEQEVEAGARRALDHMSKEARKYPPKRPGQTYIRTGTLGRGWRESRGGFVFASNGVTLRMSNRTPYTRWVQGEKNQAWMHRNRWRTVGDIMDDNQRRAQGELEKALQRAASRITTEAG